MKTNLRFQRTRREEGRALLVPRILGISLCALALALPAAALDPAAFLAADGRLDLDAARASGASGTVALDGWAARIDPLSGEPLLRAAGGARDEESRWSGEFGWPGVNEAVQALALYQGDLIAAGAFHTAGDILVRYIARWDGSRWHPLGAGLNSLVYALAVYDGELIVGGAFSQAGGSAAANIAAWNGTSWRPLGSGAGDRILSLHVH
ncbi:MAG: hypothetical protein FJY75_09375, partial [Candidatus Eisenbacteria bacterium]|nr:hypothetical protein [Candidatus Eisenbacteria bacterium]